MTERMPAGELSIESEGDEEMVGCGGVEEPSGNASCGGVEEPSGNASCGDADEDTVCCSEPEDDD
jgi:hypothetical protein